MHFQTIQFLKTLKTSWKYLLYAWRIYLLVSGYFATVHFAIGLFAIGIFATMQITR